MTPDWNLILGFTIFATAMVGGFVKLQVNLQSKFGQVYSRLDKIEMRMNIEEKYADERAADMQIRMRDVVYKYCRDECPHKPPATNPAIRIGVDTP